MFHRRGPAAAKLLSRSWCTSVEQPVLPAMLHNVRIASFCWVWLYFYKRVFECQHEQVPTHTCRHFVRRSQLSQPVVSCRQQPKATSITREHELSHTAHGHLQFLDLHVGTYFRHLWSHRRWNQLIFTAHFFSFFSHFFLFYFLWDRTTMSQFQGVKIPKNR